MPQTLLTDIVQHPERISTVEPGTVPTLLAELEAIRVRLWARMLDSPRDDRDGDQDEDRLLTPAQAAIMLGVTVTWLYRHHRQLAFTRRLSRRMLRFSERGVRFWLAQQGGRRR